MHSPSKRNNCCTHRLYTILLTCRSSSLRPGNYEVGKSIKRKAFFYSTPMCLILMGKYLLRKEEMFVCFIQFCKWLLLNSPYNLMFQSQWKLTTFGGCSNRVSAVSVGQIQLNDFLTVCWSIGLGTLIKAHCMYHHVSSNCISTFMQTECMSS